MAEITPNVPPAGGLPPKPAEAAKIQPKKETVRINLPPKPTSSPTIKLPALPPGGPVSASPAPAAPAASAPTISVPTAQAAKPVAAAPAAAVARPATAAVAKPAAPAVPSVAPRPMAPVARVSVIDQGLALAAAIVGLASVAGVFVIYKMLDTALAN